MEVEGYSRKQKDNPFNFTEDELAEKKIALKTMKELWPEVPEFYAEIVYDMCKTKTQEEIDEIIHKVDTIPFKYAKNKIENN